MVIQKETVVIFFFHFMNKFVFCVTVIAVYGRSYYLLLLIKSFIPSKLQHCVLRYLITFCVHTHFWTTDPD